MTLDMWASMGSRADYAQVGDGVYRRGRGIFYTVHGATRIMTRAFNRRMKKTKRVSPSRARFEKRRG